MSQRFEMRLDDELAGRIDRARGDVPRATWIKKAITAMLVIVEEGQVLEKAPGWETDAAMGTASSVPARQGFEAPAPSRASESSKDERLAKARSGLPSVSETWRR